MIDGQMVESEGEWRQRIEELRELTQELAAQLVEAEVELTDLLAAINAFEFRLRAAIGPLVGRLEELGSEIAALRRQLRGRYNDFDDFEGGDGQYQAVEDAYYEPGIDYDAYRYHMPPAQPSEPLPAGSARKKLKKLYRQLARRFHPDMGVHDADRAYRTQMMMAINAAYAAGDLDRLRELASEPDLVDLTPPADEGEQMVGFLLKELGRLQRRLAEIAQEAAALRQKKNFKLMRQAQKAEAAGQDWLAAMKGQLQDEIRRKLVERDVLQQESSLQEDDPEGHGLDGEAFADAIWDMTLDTAYDTDPDIEAEDWLSRRQGDRFSYDDDLDEIID